MPDDPLVVATLRRVKSGEDLHDRLRREYDRAYTTYRAKRKRRARREPWESDLRVPYAMQIIDTELVNIVSGKPRAVIKPRRPGDDKAAKAMQIAQDYYVARDHLAEKQVPFTQQGLIYGITGAKNQWAYRIDTRYRRQFVPSGNPYAPYSNVEREPIVLADNPTFEPWDVYDMWWEPNARDVQSAGYFVLRSWLTKDECESYRKSEDNPFGLFENVDELLRTGTRNVQTSTAQESYIGKEEARHKDRFEILEIWTNDTLTVIGNRAVRLRSMPNPFWHGQKPIVAVSCRPDLFQLQGIPETDLVADIQEALWTVQNMRIDNMHLTVQRGVTIRDGSVTDPNSVNINKPRFKVLVQDHTDVQPFVVQPLPPEAYREDEKLLSQMQLVSGINPYVSGSDMSGIDQNTATGVTALQEVASRLLRFKARQLAYAGYERTFEQWVGLTKQFLTEAMAIRIDGPGDAYTWHELSPQDIVGDFDTSVEGTEESLSRQQERGEVMGLLNALAPFAQLGIINWQPILEKVASAFDFSTPEQLFNPPQPQGPAAPVAPGAAPPGGAPPQMSPGNGNGAQAGGLGQQQMSMPPLDPRIQMAAQQMGGLRQG